MVILNITDAMDYPVFSPLPTSFLSPKPSSIIERVGNIANHSGAPTLEKEYCLKWLSIGNMLLAKEMPKIEDLENNSDSSFGTLELKDHRRGLTEGDMAFVRQSTDPNPFIFPIASTLVPIGTVF